MIVQSVGNLTDLYPGWAPSTSYSSGSMHLYDRFYYDYATLYRTQPNVRVCVDFLARNIAQLGLHVFRRIGETDRERLRDHPLAQVLAQPLPPEYKITRYRLIESTMGDLGVYFNAYWLKIRTAPRLRLLRIPPQYVAVQGGLLPSNYQLNLGGKVWDFKPTEIVHFRGYNPDSPLIGLSPLETLRRVLAEEHAAGEYREYYWRNSARMNGIIERPPEGYNGTPEWSKEERERFRSQFEALYSGGPNSGKTVILEDGMTWKEASFNPKDSEYLGGRKLTREECARTWHIPLPMVGILDNATFSNIREQHKNLYQDCLGPWFSLLEGDIDLQLTPEFDDVEGVYVEFNIAEKLAGSFEEQTQAMQSAIGRPWMTADEGRARFNMPSMGGDAARLVTPLNVLVGGQASPRDSAPSGAGLAPPKGAETLRCAQGDMKALGAKAAVIDPTLPTTRTRHVEKWLEVLKRYFGRQYAALIGRIVEGAGIETVWNDGDRWDTELGEDVFRLNTATAVIWARHVAEQLGAELDEDRMLSYLQENAQRSAEAINGTTRAAIAAALLAEVPKDAVKSLFDVARDSRAQEIAESKVTSMSNFGAHEGAHQGGLKTKTWQVNSANPRPEHAAMAGETVELGETFSNGMRWPGDPAGGAENNSNCHCSVVFGRE
jgi:HK97 family phage portal protein